MVRLVDYVCEVVVCARCDNVLTILAELGIMAVDVFDGAGVAEGERVGANADDGVLLVELGDMFGAPTTVGKVDEGEIGYARYRC